MRRRVPFGLLLLLAAAALAGCRGQKPEPPKPPPPRVVVIRPAVVPVRDYWLYNGYLDTTLSVEVKSKIRGFLTEVLFQEGAEVTAGTPLYTIDKLEYNTAVRKGEAELLKSEAQIKSWKAQIVESKADLDRVNAAVAGGAESQTAQDKALATLDVRKAELAAAEANRDAAAEALHSSKILLGYTDIKAKIKGRIGRTLVDEGNLILADTTMLTTIVYMDELYVYFDVPETDFFAYQKSLLDKPGHTPLPPEATTLFRLNYMLPRGIPNGMQVPIEVGVADETGYPHVGVLDFLDNRVETGTGTIRLRGRLNNPLLANNVRLLFPGMYARVRVPKGDPTPQSVIPEDCLGSGQEGRYVLAVDGAGVVRKLPVTVGATVWKAPPPEPGKAPPGWVAVNPRPSTAPPPPGKPPAKTRDDLKSMVAVTFHDPLKADERVIYKGLQQARPGAPVTPEEWDLHPPGAAKK